MAKTYVHVNRQTIDRNRKDGGNRPPLIVRQGSKSRYGREVIIEGPSRLVYDNDSPLKCGARAWIETESRVKIIDEMSFAEAMSV